MNDEYIRRDDAINLIRNELPLLTYMGRTCDKAVKNVREIVYHLEKIPAADVVEVVRCKDCHFGQEATVGFVCNYTQTVVDIDHFCKDGFKRV